MFREQQEQERLAAQLEAARRFIQSKSTTGSDPEPSSLNLDAQVLEATRLIKKNLEKSADNTSETVLAPKKRSRFHDGPAGTT